MRERFIRAGPRGLRLCLCEWGPEAPSAPLAVILHGFADQGAAWSDVAERLVAVGWRVVAPDQRGFGCSDHVGPGGYYHFPDYVRDLDAVLVDLGASPGGFTLVGHSMGSLVTLSAAARYPEKARALALIGTTAPMGVHPAMMTSAANNDHDVIDMITYWGYSKSAQLGGNENPGMWMAGSTLRLLEKAKKDVIHLDLKACEDYSAGQEHGRSVRCPTLFILGDRDIMTPMRSAQTLVDTIADAKVCRMTKTGHSLMMEKPDALLDALITIV